MRHRSLRSISVLQLRIVYALSKMLNDLDSRAMLFSAAYAKAMAELKVLADRHCHSMTA